MSNKNEIKEIIRNFLKNNVGELVLSTLSETEIEFDIYPEVEDFVIDNGYDYLLDEEDIHSVVDEIIAEMQ